MKLLIPALDSILFTLGWFVSILLAPFAALTACGFLIFTSILGAQMRREQKELNGHWRWTAHEPHLRVGS